MIKKNLKLLKYEFDAIKVNSKYGYFLRNGINLSKNGQCILLTQSKYRFKFSVYENHSDFEVWIGFENKLEMKCDCNNELVCSHKIASLLQSIEILERENKFGHVEGFRYTRSGMIDRVLKERWQKAVSADYKIDFAKNRFGEHSLNNEQGKEYNITLRDFEKEIGYCSCPDFKTNKLGTCKHLMFVFNKIKHTPELIENKAENYPFVEVYLNPRSNYRVSWYYNGRIENSEISELIYNFFGNSTFLPDEKLVLFLSFLHKAANVSGLIVRPEVFEKVDKVYNANMLSQLRTSVSLDFGILTDNFEDSQKEMIEFITFNENSVIADDFGENVRKTTIASAFMKREVIGLKSCLVLCPENLLANWEADFNKYNISASNNDSFFSIMSYESLSIIENKVIEYDILILDEANQIRKYQSKPSNYINLVKRKHNIVISGSHLHDNLSDLYSVVGFADQNMLSPLWEFSFNHYYFDQQSKNKITGYYNLKELFDRLSVILISGPQLNESSSREDSADKKTSELDEIISENDKENNDYSIQEFDRELSSENIIRAGIDQISKALILSKQGEVLTKKRVVKIEDNGEVTIKFVIQKRE